MKKYIEEIINDFDSHTLEGIQKTGKYHIHGFRPNGPRSALRTKRLKVELAKKSDVIEVIKKYANERVANENLDNKWTFVDNIDGDTLKQRINFIGKEDVLLALISNNRLDMIEKIYTPTKTKETEVKTEHTYRQSSEDLIANLRNIISNLEKEKSLNEKEILSLKESINKHKRNLYLKENRITVLNKKLKIEEKKSSQFEDGVETINTENYSLKKKLERLNKQLEVLQSRIDKTNVYIIGGERIKGWFEQNNKGIFIFNFVDLQHDFDLMENRVDEVWIINPHIHMDYLTVVNNHDFIVWIDKLQRKFVFNDLEQVKKHMINSEGI